MGQWYQAGFAAELWTSVQNVVNLKVLADGKDIMLRELAGNRPWEELFDKSLGL